MKTIILLIVCFNCIMPCTVKGQKHSHYVEFGDMSCNVTYLVDRYYYTYFKYPEGVKNLTNFAWDLIKANITSCLIEPYNDKLIENYQYDDFVSCSNSFINVLKYLETNKTKIKIEIVDNSFNLRCGVGGLFINYTADICKDLKNFDSNLIRCHQRIFLYNNRDRKILDSISELEITERIESIKKKYINSGESSLQFALFRFTKGSNSGMVPLCPTEIDSLNDEYIREITVMISDFLEHKDIYSVVVLLPIMARK